MDNYAYYLRASRGEDPFDVGPLVARWSETYDMVVRLRPDIELRDDGVRSTSDEFRSEIEMILDDRLAELVADRRLVEFDASSINDAFDWWPLAERLAGLMEQPLFADGVPRRRPRRVAADKPDVPQLEMEM
jgi:hypothetical protein